MAQPRAGASRKAAMRTVSAAASPERQHARAQQVEAVRVDHVRPLIEASPPRSRVVPSQPVGNTVEFDAVAALEGGRAGMGVRDQTHALADPRLRVGQGGGLALQPAGLVQAWHDVQHVQRAAHAGLPR